MAMDNAQTYKWLPRSVDPEKFLRCVPKQSRYGFNSFRPLFDRGDCEPVSSVDTYMKIRMYTNVYFLYLA